MNKSYKLSESERVKLERVLAKRAEEREPFRPMAISNAMRIAMQRTADARDIEKLRTRTETAGAELSP